MRLLDLCQNTRNSVVNVMTPSAVLARLTGWAPLGQSILEVITVQRGRWSIADRQLGISQGRYGVLIINRAGSRPSGRLEGALEGRSISHCGGSTES